MTRTVGATRNDRVAHIRQFDKRLLIASRELLPPLPLGLEPWQLPHKQRRLDVGQVGLIAKLQHVPVLILLRVAVCGFLREPVRSQAAQRIRHRGIVRGHRSAFAARQILRRVKAEARGLSPLPWPNPLTTGFRRVRGVFDHDQRTLMTQIGEPLDIRHQSVQVHGQHNARVQVDRRRDLIDVDVAGVGLDVHEPHHRAGLQDGIGGRDERHRRRDHFILGPEPERRQREEQRARAARGRDHVLHAEEARELLFEQRGARTGRQEDAAQHAGRGVDVRLRERVAVELDAARMPAARRGTVSRISGTQCSPPWCARERASSTAACATNRGCGCTSRS